MKTGLFFGSFNPIHQGHLDIANYMAGFTGLNKIWFIVSPQNPLKEKNVLLDDHHRLKMVYLAVEDNKKMMGKSLEITANQKDEIPRHVPVGARHRVYESIELEHADIEFNLPQPSYTFNTLNYLKNKYPDGEFVLIIGSDNLSQFHKWKNYRQILDNHELYVYPRPESDGGGLIDHCNVKLVDAPLIKISSANIRKMISQGNDVSKMLPEPVCHYIKEMRFYRSEKV
ncbi:MAG: nicotinate-nucleotide adenylyltransferase [Bacteroidota bacterium]